MSYNVRKGSRAEDIARDVRAQDPDVALLQEVDRGTRRARGEDQAVRLGELLSMHAHYARSYDDDGGSTGQAILSRWPLSDTGLVALAGSRNIAAVGAIRWQGRRVVLVSTHFSSTYKVSLDHLLESAAARVGEARRIVEVATQAGGLLIAGGDLNCAPGSEPLGILSEALARADPGAPTFPAAQPVLAIDHILFAGGLQTVRAFVAPQGVSDHRPVVVEFTRGTPGGVGAGDR
jgi:endonuclease/exonuclease/phosphatase family metal-dependent hydrolase